MYQPPVMVTSTPRQEPGCLVRTIWFFFVGWWLGLIWLHIGFLLCFSVIFLPIGLLMLNRLASIITLRASGDTPVMQTVYQAGPGQVYTPRITYWHPGTLQYPFIARAIWFLFIGWWVGYLTAIIGYLLVATLILMPVGITMLENLPAVLTLRRR
jgi:uncharacterized membrane protein YccF (DUF307 family)